MFIFQYVFFYKCHIQITQSALVLLWKDALNANKNHPNPIKFENVIEEIRLLDLSQECLFLQLYFLQMSYTNFKVRWNGLERGGNSSFHLGMGE